MADDNEFQERKEREARIKKYRVPNRRRRKVTAREKKEKN